MTMDDVEKVARAMQECVIRDDEGEFPRLFDLLDFSGENKAHTVVNALAGAVLTALDIPAIKAAAYAQGREDAAKVCEAEQLLDPEDESDEGYMKAIDHCAAAIRAAP
jgi:hypothetical protein